MKVHKEFVELDEEIKALEGNPGRYFQHCMSLYHKMKDDSYLQFRASLDLLLDNLDKPGRVMTDPYCPLTQKGHTKLLGMLEDLKEPYKVYKDKLNDIFQMLDYFFLTGQRELKEKEQEKRKKSTDDNEDSKAEFLSKRLKNLEKTFAELMDNADVPDEIKGVAKELQKVVVSDINKKIEEENKNDN